MDRTLSYATVIGLTLMLLAASTQALVQKPVAVGHDARATASRS